MLLQRTILRFATIPLSTLVLIGSTGTAAAHPDWVTPTYFHGSSRTVWSGLPADAETTSPGIDQRYRKIRIDVATGKQTTTTRVSRMAEYVFVRVHERDSSVLIDTESGPPCPYAGMTIFSKPKLLVRSTAKAVFITSYTVRQVPEDQVANCSRVTEAVRYPPLLRRATIGGPIGKRNLVLGATRD